MGENADQIINYKKWYIHTNIIGFGSPNEYRDHGWFSEYQNHYCDNKRTGIQRTWIYLGVWYATKIYNDEDKPVNALPADNMPEMYKRRFEKMYFSGAETIILQIIPILKNGKYSLTQYNDRSGILKSQPALYEFLTPNLFFKYNIFTTEKDGVFQSRPYSAAYCETFDIVWGDVWRIACTTEGRATISAMEFLKLITRAAVLIWDLLNWPLYMLDSETVVGITRCFSNAEEDYAYSDAIIGSRWKNVKNISPKDAYGLRVLDAVDNINFVRNRLYEPKSCLEMFVLEVFRSLSDELIKRKLVQECLFCGKVFEYKEKKKYCSLVSEGRDCGKKARFKRYYKNNKKRSYE